MAVILPPNVAAPEKVTKSVCTAPCAVSVIVIVEDPFVAEKVTSPADVVSLKGVMSFGLIPVSYTHLTLPTNREV